MNVLVIKRAALGDVLRTTSILPALREKYGPAVRLTWFTEQRAIPLLEGNPLVDEVLASAPSGSYDAILNLEEDSASAQLAMRLCKDRKEVMGFGWNGREVVPAPGCERWFAMSLLGGPDRDRLKKMNTRSHPQILSEIARLDCCPVAHSRPQLHLSDRERHDAVAERRELFGSSPILGVATWAGDAWEKKTVPNAKLISLLNDVRKQVAVECYILAEEKNAADAIAVAAATGGRCAAMGTVRQFAARILQCDVLLCADSLSLHVANAVGTPKVVLVGPTSAAELELYGDGAIVTSQLGCLTCYRRSCSVSPDCMESLPNNRIADRIRSLLPR